MSSGAAFTVFRELRLCLPELRLGLPRLRLCISELVDVEIRILCS